MEALIIVFSVVVWLCMAVLCARIAQKKRRDPVIWGVVGCLTSFIGLLILVYSEDLDEDGNVIPKERTLSAADRERADKLAAAIEKNR